MSNSSELIARTIARMFKAGDRVKLGMGLPTKVADFVPKGVYVSLPSEISFLDQGGGFDASVLEALEVDEKGKQGYLMEPEPIVSGRKVIIAMEHTTANGLPKILKQCTLPRIVVNEANIIVTELGVMVVTQEGMVLKSLAPGVSIDEIQSKTEAELLIPEVITTMVR